MKHLLFLTTFCIMLSCKDQVAHLESNYKKAVKLKDYSTAVTYALQLTELNSDASNTYLDSLYSLYIKTGRLIPIIETGNLILERGANSNISKVLAEAYSQMGDYEKRIEHLQLLKKDNTDSLDINYEIGTAYYALEKWTECGKYLNKVIKDPASTTELKVVGLGDQKEQVPYYSAAMNILGFISIRQKNFVQADKIYQEIFSTAPNFKLAKNNYTLLQNLIKESQAQ